MVSPIASGMAWSLLLYSSPLVSAPRSVRQRVPMHGVTSARIGRLWPLLVAAALALAAVNAAAGALSNHQGYILAVVAPLAGLAFVGAGVLGWVLRPDNGTGRLLVVVGAIFLVLSGLWAANDPLLFTLGNALGALYLAAFAQLLLSYPAGRLRSRLERAIVISLYGVAAGAALLPTLFEKSSPGCAKCPANLFLVHDSERTGHIINGIFNVLGLVVFVGLFAVLALRWRRASPARRRVLAPVYVSGGAAAASLGIGFAVSLGSTIVGNVFWAISLVCFISLPFAFVGGLLRWRVSRAAARMLLDTGGEASPSEAERALRRALGDPSLRLAYWLEEERVYVDTDGEVLDPAARRDGRIVTEITYDGDPLAAIDYDASLSHEPELVEEVVATARVTLEKDRGVQRLRRSEARSRALLSVLPDAMIRTNREGVYLDVQGNRSGLVRPAEDLIGLSIRETLPPDLVEPIVACIDRALVTGELQTFEYELELQGERRSFEARMIPSGVDEVVSVVRDFTSERRLREELTARLAERERHLEQLGASRARIVEAGDSERRRLERNLHDGAQQRLVALSIALRLAQARMTTDTEAASEILDDAGAELAAALAELRDLARGLHPAILTDRGLEAALKSLAERAPLPVDVEVDLNRRLPPAVEVGAFYVAAESLTNVAKHAAATRVRVALTCRDDLAIVEVRDDGRGGADTNGGSGLRGLDDRVAALGGRLEIDSVSGGGTTVRAILPAPPVEKPEQPSGGLDASPAPMPAATH